MASAVALMTEDEMEARHLPEEVTAARAPESEEPASGTGEPLRDKVVSLLVEHAGNVTAVARAMGKAPAQIHRWMKRFGIDPGTYRGGRTS
jgi:transcriptional regulator of acetoin/glycerol metabolism